MTSRFDPTRAIIFDLARGQMRDDEGSARVNLPVEVLLRLCEQAGTEARRDFAQSLGSEIGRRIADNMGKNASSASVESWSEHLGGQLALMGLGELSIEQWGKALVLVVEGAPLGTCDLLSDLLGAALQRSLGRHTQLIAFEQQVPFEKQESTSFLVVAPQIAARAHELMKSGAGLGQIVEQLHQGAA